MRPWSQLNRSGGGMGIDSIVSSRLPPLKELLLSLCITTLTAFHCNLTLWFCRHRPRRPLPRQQIVRRQTSGFLRAAVQARLLQVEIPELLLLRRHAAPSHLEELLAVMAFQPGQ